MSYLLEALRKSDRERRQGEEPALASIHLQRRFGGRRRQWRWLGGAVAAVLAVAVVGAWWGHEHGIILPTLTLVSQPAPAPESPAEPRSAAAAMPDRTAPVASASGQQQPTATQVPAAATLPALWDLPASVRNHIPALKFSLHAYSDDPPKRSMVVNDRVVHEGDRIAENLTLVRITADGAVLRYRDTWFRVNVLENW